ncbi:hypothetical protein C8A03DRAFT_16303, partial [Achaetomium macrosporum]
MRLRPSAVRRRPGRYREDDGPTTADRPAFVHPDIPFNPHLVRFCAHPTLPLDYPGVGPSEAERARLAALASAQQADIGDEEDRDSDAGSEDDGSGHQDVDGVTNNDTDGEDQPNEERAADGEPETAAADGPVASQPAGPTPKDVEQGELARPAYVANIPRQQPSKNEEGIEVTALPPSHATPSPMASTNPAEAPNWSDLSDGIKYAIVYEMTREMSLIAALQQLSLTSDEVQSFLVLVQKERRKMEEFDEKLDQLLDFADPSVRDTVAGLTPITDPITAAEVRSGRSYLRLLGIDRVADNLGFWEGTAGTWHPIDIEEGSRDLVGVPDLDDGVGNMDGSNQLQDMTDAELLVRLDPPANTLNPQRLRSGAPPHTRDRTCGPLRMPTPGSLHPANFVYKAKSGRRYSALDKSDWPEWEALHDAGIILSAALTVATIRSEVPDEVDFFSQEDVESMDDQLPEDFLGSDPAPLQQYLEALGPSLPADHQPAPVDNGEPNP